MLFLSPHVRVEWSFACHFFSAELSHLQPRTSSAEAGPSPRRATGRSNSLDFVNFAYEIYRKTRFFLLFFITTTNTTAITSATSTTMTTSLIFFLSYQICLVILSFHTLLSMHVCFPPLIYFSLSVLPLLRLSSFCPFSLSLLFPFPLSSSSPNPPFRPH